MRNKIFKSIFATIIIVLVASFSIIFVSSYNYYSEKAESELTKEGKFLAAGYEEYGAEIFRIMDNVGTRVTHIDKDGVVLYDSASSGEIGNHVDREEISEAFLTGEGYSERYSETISKNTSYYAKRASDGTVIRVAATSYSAFTMLADILAPAMILVVAVTVLGFFIASHVSKSIVRPINDIDPEHPESAFVYDELKPIISKLSSQNYKVSKQMTLLRQREREFNSITFNMSEGMIVINSRAAILSCNKSAKEIFDVRSDVPRSVLLLDSESGFRDAISAALSGKNGYYSMRRGDKFYSLLATPVLHDMNVEGAVIVILDVTEKEEREALRREFTSNVSHELKTPLTSISGFAEIIRTGMAEGDEARHFADNIHKESSRLISLVGDIIKLSRLDGGEIPYDDEPIDLFKLSEEVISRLSSVAERAEISLHLYGAPAFIKGNATSAEEMIYNLCDNAIKYNRPNGKVEVTVFCEGDESCVCVKDDGIGIPQDKQDRVFERFYRVDKSHSKEIGGTGLGLSIVKHAAAYHKANIELESLEGVGTSITIRFPAMDLEGIGSTPCEI